MVNLVMEVRTTRDIGRQLLRHRSMHFQEFSQRYAAVLEPAVFREARMQDAKNRQASTPTEDAELQKWWMSVQKMIDDMTRGAYTNALERGIAKEVARVVLPEGMTPSVMYSNATVRDWIHYVNLRGDGESGTQLEHMLMAREARKVLLEHVPSLQGVLKEVEGA